MELSQLGIPTAKINQFKSKNIYTVNDLVKFFPRKYLDFRRPASLYQALDGELISVIIDIYDITDDGKNLKIRGTDINNNHIFITYFGQLYIGKQLNIGDRVIFCGKVQVGYNGLVSMTNPTAFSKDIKSLQKIVPVYSKISGMSDDYFNKVMTAALAVINKKDYLTTQIKSMFNLMDYSDALNNIHNPENPQLLTRARERFLFDDLFYYNYLLARNVKDSKKGTDIVFKHTSLRDNYIASLPFELTIGQKNAIKDAHSKISNSEKINLLVQGDVGCGKTEIAKALLLEAAENNYQGVLLAPTTVLAKQHYNDLLKSFNSLNINVRFLNSDIKQKDRKQLLKELKDGEVDILVGTHAVFSSDVEYSNLGIVVVDEEHKFGVSQKEKLRLKSLEGIHYVSLSATPIPRTLASTLYGDEVDVCTINTRPNGRLEIKTNIISEIPKIYDVIKFIKNKGEQSYIVCPVIDSGENDDISYSVDFVYKDAVQNLGPLGIKVGMINGKMKADEVENEINKFLNKEYDVLISTTIIEVGVNVPNATFIAIIGSERFGLSQLHQLRGRVGRSSKQSYCALCPTVDLTKKEYAKTNNKLMVMVSTNNGFVIAEEDLKFRGPGDLIGTSQTGDNKYIIEMLSNQELNKKIHDLCVELVKWNKTREHFDYYLLNENKPTM